MKKINNELHWSLMPVFWHGISNTWRLPLLDDLSCRNFQFSAVWLNSCWCFKLEKQTGPLHCYLTKEPGFLHSGVRGCNIISFYGFVFIVSFWKLRRSLKENTSKERAGFQCCGAQRENGRKLDLLLSTWWAD